MGCLAVTFWLSVVFLLIVLVVSNSASTRKAEAKPNHCNKTVDIYEDVSSPDVTSENVGKPMLCSYRFRSFRGTPRDWILRIRFKKFKVGTLVNATTCLGGYMQIVDGNQKTDVSNRKEPGSFCGEIEQPQTFISETSFVKLVFYTDNFTDQTYFSFDTRAEQQYEVYLRYGQHPELYPNRRGRVEANPSSSGGGYCDRRFEDCKLQTCYVQSPAYPGIYPRNLHCRYHLNTRLQFIKLYIENEEFNIDGQRCENIMTCPMRPISSGSEHCPYDFIRIYDGTNETAPVIGTFCGMGKFPYSIIGTGTDLFVEFVSSAAGPLLNTGFHFNVGNWPGHVETAGYRNGSCDWILSRDALSSPDAEGIFLSVAHWYPPHTSCTYLMKGESGQIVRLYFPSFRINRIESPIAPVEGDCGESLTLYDASWPDDSRIIKTFCDTFSRAMEKHDFVSTGNSMFVRFESKTGSYSGSSLYYWAHYDFFNNTASGDLVEGTACDEIFVSWKSPKGFLRSPRNSLVYKQHVGPQQDITCLYRFITDKRLYARVILTIDSVHFKDHPYSASSCNDCWNDRVDKILVWEPRNDSSVSTRTVPGSACICSNSTKTSRTFISKGINLNLQMVIEGTHAASSYFKHSAPLFTARYEFVHEPLCGPSILQAATEGELHFPHYEAMGFSEPSRNLRCFWEIRVNDNRDIWLHFDKFMFTSRSCDDGLLRVYLPNRLDAMITVCGENATALKDVPIVTSLDLSAGLARGQPKAVLVEFRGSGTPARAAFKVAWTELFHMDRTAAAAAIASPRLPEFFQGDDAVCEFQCPGDSGLCIPSQLVCNGIANCPNITGGPSGDETFELCATSGVVNVDSWATIILGLAGGGCFAVVCLILLCRSCCHKRADRDNIHVPY